VADSGPLIVFGRALLLETLRQVVGEVVVPASVFQECTSDPMKPGAKILTLAAKSGQIRVHEDVPSDDFQAQASILDQGERSAMALAKLLGCAVLMDEKLGRHIAANHGIPIIGSAGVLIAAKQQGLISHVRPILEKWQAFGYFMSADLRHAVLSRVDEL
jgi:predicted nucleic acid-binding protein